MGVLIMQVQEAGGIGFVSGDWPLDPDKPSLIFIHGAALNKDCWESQLESLSEVANTIAIDLPGHGDSQGPGKEDIPGYARSVMAFIDNISPPNPVLCGFSMGGAVTQHILINDQDRFQAGILINTGARLKVMPLILETIKKNYSDFVCMVSMFGISPKSDAKKIGPKIAACSQCRPEVAMGDFRACDNFNVTGELGEIQVPVLILTADDDNITPTKYGAFLETKIKNATILNIKDAGHFSLMEKPHDVNRAISDFLTRV